MLEEKWCTTTEAAEIIGVSTSRVRSMCASGLVACQKIGPRVWLIDRTSAEKLAVQQPSTGRPRKNPKY